MAEEPKQPKALSIPKEWRDKTAQSAMRGIVGESREEILREVLQNHPKLTREKALRMIVAAGG